MPRKQKTPARSENEPKHCITPFAPFRPDGPTAQDFKDELQFGALTNEYLPFSVPAIATLSQLYEVALGERSESVATSADEGTQIESLQIRLQKARVEFAKADQDMAAFNLVDAVCWGIRMIEKLVANKPDVMRQIAAKMSSWPVEVTLQSDWSYIIERLNDLKLCQDESVRQVEPPFYPAQGDSGQLPARLWAQQAVRCLAQTRDTQKRLPKIRASRILQGRWEIAPAPEWALKARDLPDFSADKQVLRQWASLIRDTIREQMPDFHNRSEWARYRSAINRAHSKKPGKVVSKGVAQNAILDDIVAALKTIAPRQPGK